MTESLDNPRPSSLAVLMRFNSAVGRYSPIVRAGIVLIAGIIIYLRTPGSFTHPQFWAEDSMFFVQNYLDGWASLLIPSGYFLTIPRIVSFVAGFWNPAYAPTIYNVTAVLLTLVVVWLATSPRFDIPFHPLIALAVVLVPTGNEVLGTICNAQWIVPIGAFVILFMRPASKLVLAAELIFVALVTFTGPVVLFFAPLFVARTWLMRRDHPAFFRLVPLTIVVLSGSLAQGLCILTALNVNFVSVPPAAYDWKLWYGLAPYRLAEPFGPAFAKLFIGPRGWLAAAIAAAMTLFLALRQPYRLEKIFALVFGLTIIFSGLLKFRQDLNLMMAGGQRYFYIGSILLFWFICWSATGRLWRYAGGAFVILTEIGLLSQTIDTPRTRTNFEWPVWSAYISSGLPLSIPTDPQGWFINLPAKPDGKLAKFAPWVGTRLSEVTPIAADRFCAGTIVPVSPLNEINGPAPRWLATGAAWDIRGNRPVRLIILTDSDDRVLGFGLPGFTRTEGPNTLPVQSGWTAMFSARAGGLIRAYAVSTDDPVCFIGEVQIRLRQ